MPEQSISHTTRAWLEVDLAALRTNAAAMRARAGVPILPMVKADAYGLGAVPVMRALAKHAAADVWGFGLATITEGEELRAAGYTGRLLVFTPLLATDLPQARALDLTPLLHRAADIVRWASLGGGVWHLSVDTGMSRAGVRWDEISRLLDAVRQHPPEGACTHFHSAELEDDSLAVQEARFREAIDMLPVRPAVLHAENSPAVEHRAPSPWSIVRPGVFLYGIGSDGALVPEPVARLCARIVDMRTVRDGETVGYGATWRAEGARRIATVSAGYADGVRRALGNRGRGLVRQTSVPIVGSVTMDMTMLDVTGVDCAVGDVVTLLGRDGEMSLTATDVARAGGFSPYELLTSLKSRVPRVYLNESMNEIGA
jgi:alanine racemase